MEPHSNLVGPQIRKLRYQREWSQSKLATKLQLAGFDISRSTVAKIESRIRWVPDWQLYYIARALGVELADLFPPLKPGDPQLHQQLKRCMTTRW